MNLANCRYLADRIAVGSHRPPVVISTACDVRFTFDRDPTADIPKRPFSAISGREQMQQQIQLFNYLGGALLEKPGHVKAERFGCFEVDDQLELVWRLHGKIGGFLASKDTVDVSCRWPPLFNLIDSIGEQAARRGEKSERINRR